MHSNSYFKFFISSHINTYNSKYAVILLLKRETLDLYNSQIIDIYFYALIFSVHFTNQYSGKVNS